MNGKNMGVQSLWGIRQIKHIKKSAINVQVSCRPQPTNSRDMTQQILWIADEENPNSMHWCRDRKVIRRFGVCRV